jgi:hypothetical protein
MTTDQQIAECLAQLDLEKFWAATERPGYGG